MSILVWRRHSSTGTGQLYSPGIGETRTGALWMQDAWKIVPNLKLTLGGRLETWRALDGFNSINDDDERRPDHHLLPVSNNQPELNSTNFSPKASLSFDPNKDWNITANFGEAYRYPTVTELYQNITVGGVATFANPLLAPEQDFTGELNVERKWNDGRVRLTLFKERTNNAIISQTNLVTNPTTGVQTPTTHQQCRCNPDAGCRIVRRKRQCADPWPSIVRQRHLCGFTILSDPSWAGTIR